MTNSYESRNIYCEGFVPKNVKAHKDDLHLSFNNKDERKNNIEVRFDSFPNGIINKDELAQDLIMIAIYIYIADCSTKRGGMTNAYDDFWNINLNFYIPVRKPDFWNREDVKTALSEAFGFAVGHKFNFTFGKFIQNNKQLLFDVYSTDTKNLDIDCISMFSGGLDSLYSTLSLIEEGRKPILISHQSNTKLISKRNSLKEEIEKEYQINLEKLELVAKKKNGQSLEFTQRSRSLVFACYGIGFAKCLNLKDVYLSDNGIISHNLRSTAQNVGTLNTRSTNPKLIYYINEISKLIWGSEAPIVENKLISLTKGDVVKGIKELGKENLLPLSHSCVSTFGISKAKPFCGVCSQCVDRRFAIEYADISDGNEPRFNYEVDIFNDPLTKQNDRKIGKTHAENYYRKAKIINNATESAFMEYFSELWGFIPSDIDETEFLSNTMILHQNFSNQIFEVIAKMSAPFFKGELPEGTLFDMVYKDSKIPLNVNDYKPIKPVRLKTNIKKKYCTFDKEDFKISNKEIYFMNKLAENKGGFVSYKDLVSKETNHIDLAKKRKEKIDEKFQDFCKDNKIDYFELFENKRGYGYKLTLENDEILAL